LICPQYGINHKKEGFFKKQRSSENICIFVAEIKSDFSKSNEDLKLSAFSLPQPRPVKMKSNEGP